MEKTWASGAIELLKHADSHLSLTTAFDRRIAFISIDNAIEIAARTFLQLPSERSGVKVATRDLKEVENSFPGLISLLWKNASAQLIGIEATDVEHYHRIRNKLYHDGTGLSVDEDYLMAYRQIAIIMLKNLFNVVLPDPKPAASLEYLIHISNEVEIATKAFLQKNGIDSAGTYKWEEARQKGIITDYSLTARLTELRLLRGSQALSNKIDPKQIEYGVHLAETILNDLK